MTVKCKCGQDNRVPDEAASGARYRCGKCRAELHFIAVAVPLSPSKPDEPYPLTPDTMDEDVRTVTGRVRGPAMMPRINESAGTDWSWVPAIVSMALLLLAVMGRWPYGFYTILRLAARGSAGYLAMQAYELEKVAWVWIMGSMAALFNPLVPIRLPWSDWQAIDLVAAIVFAVSIPMLRKR